MQALAPMVIFAIMSGMLKKQKALVPLEKSFVKNLKIAIVRPDYHQELNTNLEEYCRNTLIDNGVTTSHIKTFVVPGSWEIPLMVQTIAESKKYDAIVAFGVIVKGETYHFDMIANEVARSLMQISLDYSIPVALEVLAVYNIKQAEIRAARNEHNKGIEGATAVLKSLAILQAFQN